jgi:hypothetical protein
VKENGRILDSSDVPADSAPEYLAMITHNGVPPHHLTLKPGAVCCIMRNMSMGKGLVKNARVIVERLLRHIIYVRVINNLTGVLEEPVAIPRIRFEFSPKWTSWTVQRIQFPLRLAYATTYHGCVGLTLDRTVIDLRTPVFAHGQLYTALSRVRHRDHSRALLPEPSSQTEPSTSLQQPASENLPVSRSEPQARASPSRNPLQDITNVVYKDLLM